MFERVEQVGDEIISALRANPGGLSRQSLGAKTSSADDAELSKALSWVKEQVVKLGNGKSSTYMLADTTVAAAPKVSPVVSGFAEKFKAAKEAKPRVSKEPVVVVTPQKPTLAQTASQLIPANCANIDPDSKTGLVAYVLWNAAPASMTTAVLLNRVQRIDPDFSKSTIYGHLTTLERRNLIDKAGDGRHASKRWRVINMHPFDGIRLPKAIESREETSEIDRMVDVANQTNDLTAKYLAESVTLQTLLDHTHVLSKAVLRLAELAKTKL